MYVDSVCFAKTKSETNAISKERLGKRNSGMSDAPISGQIECNGASDGITVYEAASQTSSDSYVFSSCMTCIMPEEYGTFNKFSITYSTNSIVRGVAYCSVL